MTITERLKSFALSGSKPGTIKPVTYPLTEIMNPVSPTDLKKLLTLCGGKKDIVLSLVQTHVRRGRSIKWSVEKAIYDLERDRGTI